MPPESKYLNARVRRNEDARLLTGRARFVDDVQLPGMLHVAFVRSDHAHARLIGVDVAAARRRRGVAAVYTIDDLGDYGRPAPLLVPPPPIPGLVFHACTHTPLARGKVRYAGEPIAMIVAESRYIAEDAVRDVLVDVDPLDAVGDLEAALAPTAPRVHEQLDSNAAAHVVQRKGDYAAARAGADAIVARRFSYDRGAAAAIENRSVVAHWDRLAEELTIWDTTQAPIPIRNGLAARLGLLESRVRVVAPFVGGGFGPKIMMFYPEELLVPWASMRLARPVKWTEDRQENFYATTQERGQVHDAEMALTRDGRILGVRDTFLFDTGAYDPYGLTIPINTQCTLLGPYDIPTYDSTFTAVFTNRTIVTPVRGAGRQHGVFVSERLLDIAARELGIDRVEIRLRNLLTPDRFPHNHEIMFQDSAAARLRQRRLSPGARTGGSGDRLRGVDARSAAAHRRGQMRRRRHRVLRRGHRHRTVRRRAGHRRAERRGAGGDWRRNTRPGPLHGVRAGRRRRARRGRRPGAGRHRRHARVSMGHRHVCEPRRCRRGQRLPCGGREGA